MVLLASYHLTRCQSRIAQAEKRSACRQSNVGRIARTPNNTEHPAAPAKTCPAPTFHVPTPFATSPERPKTLNAIAPLASDRQARSERNLRQCARLAEMAMQQAETAHVQALRDAEPPPERPLPAPGALPTYMPPSTRAAYDRTMAAQLFQEFSRCARQAILLEARLDSFACNAAHAMPGFAERAPADAPPPHARSRPSDPGDGMRIDHERLDDEDAGFAAGDPQDTLHALTADLGAAIAHATLADLRLPEPPASPKPRAATPPISPDRRPTAHEPARPTSIPKQVQPRASPTRQ